MNRGTIARFSVALAVLLLAGWLWIGRAPHIDQSEAEARATRLLSAYAAQSGQPQAHFTNRRVLVFSDEWDFIWAYRPCVAVGELRIVIRRSGAARYLVLPDCAPVRGFAVGPRKA